MVQIELPHVNVLSKVDLMEQYGKLGNLLNFLKVSFDVRYYIVYLHLVAFGLDYYTEVMDLSYLLEQLPQSSFFLKYKKLNEALIGLVEDYSLVSFVPLNVQVGALYLNNVLAKPFLFFICHCSLCS